MIGNGEIRMSDTHWKTKITQIKPNEVRLRGYRIDELMGKITFSEAIYLTLKGELPSPEVATIIEAILVSSIDHGVTPPSALAARTVASTGADLNAAVATGILAINRYHGGAIYDCMGMIQEGLQRVKELGKPVDTVAEEMVAEYRAAKKRMAGIGHRIHTNDPRTAKLFSMAEESGVAGEGIQMLQALEEALAKSGKSLPINVDGAIAALLVDLNIPQGLANAFFIMARVPGLVAQVYEEQTTQPPMRNIHPLDHEYDGPGPRGLKR
ncbi:MAG: citryl-CoA lyase [Chloroflexota bacterium]